MRLAATALCAVLVVASVAFADDHRRRKLDAPLGEEAPIVPVIPSVPSIPGFGFGAAFRALGEELHDAAHWVVAHVAKPKAPPAPKDGVLFSARAWVYGPGYRPANVRVVKKGDEYFLHDVVPNGPFTADGVRKLAPSEVARLRAALADYRAQRSELHDDSKRSGGWIHMELSVPGEPELATNVQRGADGKVTVRAGGDAALVALVETIDVACDPPKPRSAGMAKALDKVK